MVRLVHMAQLMDNDVVDDGLRSHHALPMEGEIALWRTRGPAMTEIADIHRSWLDAGFRRVVVHSLRKAISPSRCVVLAKRGSCTLLISALDDVPPQAESAILEKKRSILVDDERKAIRSAEIEEALAVSILAQDP